MLERGLADILPSISEVGISGISYDSESGILSMMSQDGSSQDIPLYNEGDDNDITDVTLDESADNNRIVITKRNGDISYINLVDGDDVIYEDNVIDDAKSIKMNKGNNAPTEIKSITNTTGDDSSLDIIVDGNEIVSFGEEIIINKPTVTKNEDGTFVKNSNGLPSIVVNSSNNGVFIRMDSSVITSNYIMNTMVLDIFDYSNNMSATATLSWYDSRTPEVNIRLQKVYISGEIDSNIGFYIYRNDVNCYIVLTSANGDIHNKVSISVDRVNKSYLLNNVGNDIDIGLIDGDLLNALNSYPFIKYMPLYNNVLVKDMYVQDKESVNIGGNKSSILTTGELNEENISIVSNEITLDNGNANMSLDDNTIKTNSYMDTISIINKSRSFSGNIAIAYSANATSRGFSLKIPPSSDIGIYVFMNIIIDFSTLSSIGDVLQVYTMNIQVYYYMGGNIYFKTGAYVNGIYDANLRVSGYTTANGDTYIIIDNINGSTFRYVKASISKIDLTHIIQYDKSYTWDFNGLDESDQLYVDYINDLATPNEDVTIIPFSLKNSLGDPIGTKYQII